MKKKGFLIFGGVLLASLIVVGVVYAFDIGNGDGVWEFIEDITETSAQTVEGAECSRWGTVPPSTSGDQGTGSISDWNPGIQTGSNTDENQIRYGLQQISGTNQTCANTDYDVQSGLGFDGNNAIGTNLGEGDEFWIGRLTHYNKPIGLTDIGSGDRNFLEYADIDLTVTGLACPGGTAPGEGSTLTFTYRVFFDETPNNGTGDYCDYESGYGYTYECPYTVGTDPVCPYDGGINGAGCSDRTLIGSAPPATSFTCSEGLGTDGIYTITLLGFQPTSTYNGCSTQTYNSSAITTSFITREQTNSHACLWATISDFVPTAVSLDTFNAKPKINGIELQWETITEVDNAGFYIYRSLQKEKPEDPLTELIPGQSPGSDDGAHYQYLDTTAKPGVKYYYWLEDVDLSLRAKDEYGPVGARRLWWLFIPLMGR